MKYTSLFLMLLTTSPLMCMQLTKRKNRFRAASPELRNAAKKLESFVFKRKHPNAHCSDLAKAIEQKNTSNVKKYLMIGVPVSEDHECLALQKTASPSTSPPDMFFLEDVPEVLGTNESPSKDTAEIYGLIAAAREKFVNQEAKRRRRDDLRSGRPQEQYLAWLSQRS